MRLEPESPNPNWVRELKESIDPSPYSLAQCIVAARDKDGWYIRLDFRTMKIRDEAYEKLKRGMHADG